MRLAIIGFCIGVISLVQFPVVPSVLLVFGCGLGFLLMVVKWPNCLLAVGFCFGLLWASLDALDTLQADSILLLDSGDVSIKAKILGIPESSTWDHGQRVTRFFAKVLCIGSDDQAKEFNCDEMLDSYRVRLSWYGEIPGDLGPEQVWHLKVRLKRPHGFANEGGFDYEKWLFSHRIESVGKVVGFQGNRRVSMPIFSVDQTRKNISDSIQSQFDQFSTVGLFSALIVGDRSFIASDQWGVLRATGTSHLFAISGLHIGLFAGLFYGLTSWLWRFLVRGSSLVAAPYIASVSGLIAAIMYSAAAGFSIPTLRALVMLSVWVIFSLVGRQSRMSDGLLGAAFAVLLVFPRSPLDPGFWLSFSAVLIIFWALNGRLFWVQRNRKKAKVFRQIVLVQWVVFVGLAPLLIVLFGQVSLISPLVNMLAVPFVSLFLLPFSLIGIVLLWLWPVVGMWWIQQTLRVFDVAWQGLEYLEQNLSSAFPFADEGLLCSVLLVLAAILVLAPRAMPYKWLGLFAFLPFVFPLKESIGPGQLKLIIFDVGHGLSVLARTQNHSLLFDAGNRYSATRNAGESIVLPYLRHKGIKQLDKLILSHSDLDHIGGAKSILEGIPVLGVIGSTNFLSHPLRVHNSNPTSYALIEPCRKGQRWSWEGVNFEFLYPDAQSETLFESSNDQSCMLKIVGQGYSVLIPGDIERPVEEYLLQGEKGMLKADLLIAPHHGSNTSSTSGFINAVQPDQVVFTAGYQDRFGHPTEAVIKRYQVRQVEMLNSSLTGSIEYDFIATDKMPNPRTYRNEYKAYWRLSDGG